jgi:hypothetical protein
MSIKQRIRKLEVTKYGSKPPLAVVFPELVSRISQNDDGSTVEILERGMRKHIVPDGPLVAGGELRLRNNEPMEDFRDRIRNQYEAAWGIKNGWIELITDVTAT